MSIYDTAYESKRKLAKASRKSNQAINFDSMVELFAELYGGIFDKQKAVSTSNWE